VRASHFIVSHAVDSGDRVLHREERVMCNADTVIEGSEGERGNFDSVAGGENRNGFTILLLGML
jgi:hypothetical protein